MMFTVSNEKFWFARTECGHVVGSGDHELTRDNLPRDTAALIAAAPDLLAESRRLLARLQEMAIHPSHYAGLAAAIARATGGQ